MMPAEQLLEVEVARIRETFFEAAAERLARLDAGLLRLGRDGGSAELPHALARAARSIEDAARVLRYPEVAHLTRGLREVLERLGAGRVVLTGPLLGLLLCATEELRAVVDAARTGGCARPGADALLAALREGEAGAAPAPAGVAVTLTQGPAADRRRVRIRIRPRPQLLARGADAFLLLRELAALGDAVEVQADVAGLPPLERLDPGCCYLAWTVSLRSAATEAQIRGVFGVVEGLCAVDVEDVEETAMP